MNVNFRVENATQIKKWNNDRFQSESKNPQNYHVYKKCHIFNTSIYTKYLGSIIDDSVIICNKVIEVTKTSNIF